jgi:predicted GNAT family acetyltransferase
MERSAEQLAAAVTDQPQRQRYELDVDGAVAFIDYRKSAGAVAMLHAEVPPQLGGRGVGTALVQGALRLARAESLRIQPLCGFVAVTLRRHPEW